MIRHIVMLHLSAPDPADLPAVMSGLAALVGQIDGFTGFSHGPNLDFEGKSPDYAYGFIGTFTDAQAVARYAGDPRHQALGARLVAMCSGGADGIMVIDLEARA